MRLLRGLCVLMVVVAAAPTYDQVVDSIIAHSKRAAALHNNGDPAGAQEEVQRALDASDRAKRMDPDHPQAYLSTATFLLNVHRFEESLANWRLARQRLPPGQQYIDMVDERIRHTRLGLVSTRRDAVYQSGKGNISEAVGLVMQQLAIYRSPRFLFDLATMQVMLAETNTTNAEQAAVHFAEAQDASRDGIAGFMRAFGNQGKGALCPRSTELHPVENLPDLLESTPAGAGAEQYHVWEAQPGFVLTARNVSLYGQSAVVAHRSTAECTLHVYGSSTWPYLGLHGEFWLEEIWKHSKQFELFDNFLQKFPPPDPSKPVKKLAKAALLVQFASTNYYHFVMEVLPRLMLLQPVLEVSPLL
eukprot:TRINITY_DN9288_c0_g1_i1.p1 TRINITY_DN9288_c0_g1~~TRINITY_DN9288_c0_g1_i1.p1  ORF type:complete len:360 (-),score=72.65 TRINITY_DN9288_c0_g1_i1:869-1948(-)